MYIYVYIEYKYNGNQLWQAISKLPEFSIAKLGWVHTKHNNCQSVIEMCWHLEVIILELVFGSLLWG
jgi:hypothetical protein